MKYGQKYVICEVRITEIIRLKSEIDLKAPKIKENGANAEWPFPISPLRSPRENHRAGDKLFNSIPGFSIPAAANVWPIFVCFASQQLCLLFCFFYSFYFHFLQLYAATFGQKGDSVGVSQLLTKKKRGVEW